MKREPLDSSCDNLVAWRLGEVCRKAAAEPKCGDYIDRGLILLRMLREAGFLVIPTEGGTDDGE